MPMKRKIKKKIVKKRKNPMTISFDNIRRWAYLNFPKYNDEIKTRNYYEGWKDSGIINDFIEYFSPGKGPYSVKAYLLLKPYAQLWLWIQNEKWTKNKQSEVWRYYLIDKPEMFKTMYL